MENYIATLADLDKPVMWLNKINVLPFSGRILGLYPREGLNVFWTNPDLDSAISARTLLNNSDWINLGGDRTWISPEIELFIPDLFRPLESHRVPKAIDPADYQLLRYSENIVELETVMDAYFFRSKCKAAMRLRKRITALDVPAFPLPPEVSAAGYELKCTLSILEGCSAIIRPAIWNLLQVPGGGNIIVPIRNRLEPVNYCGQPQYRQTDDRIYAAVPADLESYKFGIPSDRCCGLMLYLNCITSQPFLIARWFNVGASKKYFDVPFNNFCRHGTVQQIYVDDGTYGKFGEMEHHSIAIVLGNCTKVTDTCTTWAFAGPATQLQNLVEFFINTKTNPLTS